MNSPTLRSLSLAHAAIKHALYFLEIDARDRAASHCSYAAEQLQRFAASLNQETPHPQEYQLIYNTLQSLLLRS